MIWIVASLADRILFGHVQWNTVNLYQHFAILLFLARFGVLSSQVEPESARVLIMELKMLSLLRLQYILIVLLVECQWLLDE